jgi:hypothetical protein
VAVEYYQVMVLKQVILAYGNDGEEEDSLVALPDVVWPERIPLPPERFVLKKNDS